MRETASIQDRVPIRRVVPVVKSAGGTLIPDNAQEKPMEGEVIAVGDGARDANGKLYPLDVKTGDRVLFGKWAGSEIKLDGRQGYPQPEGPQRLLAKSCGSQSELQMMRIGPATPASASPATSKRLLRK